MAYENLVVETSENTATITLNRPKANALSLELMRELREAVAAADEDAAVRVIIITGGKGKFFAAGADIPTIAGTLDDPLSEGKLLAEGLDTVNRIEACTKPVLAAVNGMALGGGCEICLACHLRIASSNAMFGQPEINLGIIPGWGGMHRLPKIIGNGRAYDWLMTGRTISAEEARDAGLVSQVVAPEELPEAAMKLAQLLASKPPIAMGETLGILKARALHPEQGQELERAGFEKAATSKDAREGVQAFLEKRKPNFAGE